MGSGRSSASKAADVSVDFETSPQQLTQALAVFGEELERFVRMGPTPEELAVVKQYVGFRWPMNYDNPNDIADWIESDFVWQHKICMPEDYLELAYRLTPRKAVTLMRRSWNFSRLLVTIQGQAPRLPQYRKAFADLRRRFMHANRQ